MKSLKERHLDTRQEILIHLQRTSAHLGAIKSPVPTAAQVEGTMFESPKSQGETPSLFDRGKESQP
jgi:hypothetical protein